jgi:DNA-binding NtrC family response regulator
VNDKPELLIVDDDPSITDLLTLVLSEDFVVHTAASRREARGVLERLGHAPQLALVDLGLPPSPHRPEEGFRLVGELLACSPAIRIVVLSGQSEEANARHARTLGAIEFIAKPCEPGTLKRLLAEVLALRAAEPEAAPGGGLLGASPPMEKLRRQIGQFAAAPFPVLIEGESGSGKELVARALHTLSPRTGRAFFALNCAAISPTLVEPTLFGYAKGAFTGATQARAGYFEEARESTLFLDEIGELPLELQAKLLRVLENGEFQRVGETLTRASNARVLAATNRDLRAEMRHGRFRADLYHRLSVFTITVPPLRELGEDRFVLLEHFRAGYAQQARLPAFELDDTARRLWRDYAFPGNVRELRNIVIRLTAKYAGRAVDAGELQAELDADGMAPGAAELPAPDDPHALQQAAQRHLQSGTAFDLDLTLRRWERSYIDAAMALTHGNLTRAAKLLGMHRTTLYHRIQSYSRIGAPPGHGDV